MQRRRRWSIETLEPRLPFAAQLDAVQVDLLGEHVVPGQTALVASAVANRGLDASDNYAVQWRLSRDAVIDATDLLLGESTRPSVAAGATDEWTTTVIIPNSAVHADYYVGMILIDQNVATDTTVDAQQVSVDAAALRGQVSYQGRTRNVSIVPRQGGLTPIRDDVVTWVVIHGRNSSPQAASLSALATSLDVVQPDDQVLWLDWSDAAASGSLGGAGENYIKPVATWAAAALRDYGFTSSQLNLVGHSWGAYVAAELAERFPSPTSAVGQVHTIVAIDPAADYPGGSYNPLAKGEVAFARNSEYSWAFYATGGSFGSPKTASTADESFVITGSDHSKAVNVVASVISDATAASPGSNSLGGQLSLQRLLVTQTFPSTWRADRYDSRGRRVTAGSFEGVIATTSRGTMAFSLRYWTASGEKTVLNSNTP